MGRHVRKIVVAEQGGDGGAEAATGGWPGSGDGETGLGADTGAGLWAASDGRWGALVSIHRQKKCLGRRHNAAGSLIGF